MSKAEKDLYRLIHPATFRFYDPWLQTLKENMGHERLLAVNGRHPDGSVDFRVRYKDSTVESLEDFNNNVAIVPIWPIGMAGYSHREVQMMILETFDAVTNPIQDKTIINRGIAISPYYGGRSDHPSTTIDGQIVSGESLSARLFPKLLAASGCNELITLDIHSDKATDLICKANIEHLNITALPDFVDDLFNNKIITKDTLNKVRVACLDYGSLQRNILLTLLLGLDPKETVAVFDKSRDIRGEIIMEMVYPDRSDFFENTTVLSADDLGDTLGSALNLTNYIEMSGARELHFLATHGVLSHPALDNLDLIRRTSVFQGLHVTDSLPFALFDYEGEPGVRVIEPSTAKLFSEIVPAVIEYGAKKIANNPNILSQTPYEHLIPYILNPKDKEQVMKDFLNNKY